MPVNGKFCKAGTGNFWQYTLFTLIFIITHTQKRKSSEELKTLDIGTRLLDNAAFVRIHEVKELSKDFWEVRGLKSRGFQL